MILAILQARCSSTRLPAKVLKPLLNDPMIWHQWQRIKRAKGIDHCILATSTDPSDDPLADYFMKKNEPVFRGSLEDVLDRFYQCALIHQPQHVVRITGDCPLIAPEIIDKVIHQHLSEENDYTSLKHFPNGMNTEIFNYETLQATHSRASRPPEREHVTYYMYQKQAGFKLGYHRSETDLSALRLTVDYPEDFLLIAHIYKGLYPHKPDFRLKDILVFLDQNPELLQLNAGMIQKQVESVYNSTILAAKP